MPLAISTQASRTASCPRPSHRPGPRNRDDPASTGLTGLYHRPATCESARMRRERSARIGAGWDGRRVRSCACAARRSRVMRVAAWKSSGFPRTQARNRAISGSAPQRLHVGQPLGDLRLAVAGMDRGMADLMEPDGPPVGTALQLRRQVVEAGTGAAAGSAARRAGRPDRPGSPVQASRDRRLASAAIAVRPRLLLAPLRMSCTISVGACGAGRARGRAEQRPRPRDPARPGWRRDRPGRRSIRAREPAAAASRGRAPTGTTGSSRPCTISTGSVPRADAQVGAVGVAQEPGRDQRDMQPHGVAHRIERRLQVEPDRRHAFGDRDRDGGAERMAVQQDRRARRPRRRRPPRPPPIRRGSTRPRSGARSSPDSPGRPAPARPSLRRATGRRRSAPHAAPGGIRCRGS